jgi:hypothetical protein
VTTIAAGGTRVEASRTHRDEYVPTRNAIGTKARGWAYWRGLASGPALFVLLFVVVGAALANLGLWGVFWVAPEVAERYADPRFYRFAIGLGAVFVLAGLTALRVVLTSMAEAGRFAAASGREGPPWTWDHAWQPEAMGPDYEPRGGSVLGRVAILSFIALINVALGGVALIGKAIILLFDAFGLLILYDTVTQAINRARFRRPTIAWHTFPAQPGGILQATVHFAVPMAATGRATATLRCLQEREQAVVSIYRETRAFDVLPPVAALDVSFAVPHDLPATNLAAQPPVYWQVVVQVPVEGPDFEAIFLAPVYAASTAPLSPSPS